MPVSVATTNVSAADEAACLTMPSVESTYVRGFITPRPLAQRQALAQPHSGWMSRSALG